MALKFKSWKKKELTALKQNKTMREIKFRAYDLKNKKWIESVIVHSNGQFSNKGGMWLNYRSILMQFTGFKDKNGKEIYEGDILCYNNAPSRYQSNILKEVKWRNNFTALNGWNFCKGDNWEIIGNIYENPELIK